MDNTLSDENLNYGDEWYFKTEVVYSTNGSESHVLRACKVPRINDRILNSIFYLYPSVEAAAAGEESGGTGFFVAVKSETHPHNFDIYAVSNEHVVHAPGFSPVIRLNHAFRSPQSKLIASEREIMPLAINQWTAHPDGDDLAITPLGRVDDRVDRVPACIGSSMFLTDDVIFAFDVGPGDDVYMVGRFVHHAGEYLNTPSVRSGIISLMPSLIEFEEGGFKQEAFLIEMRSISGYSGSPVMWQLPLAPTSWHKYMRDIQPWAQNMAIGPWLIGVDCGNFKYYNPVYARRESGGKIVRDETDLEAKSHAGQAIVIPAWKLQELLNMEEFVMARKEEDRRLTEAQRNSPVERDVATPQGNQPLTREGFEEALRRASRKTSSPDEETNET